MMNKLDAQTHPLPWWAAGILLGLIQVLAISLVGPLEVSNEFVVADAKALEQLAPEYAESHPLIGDEEHTTFGYGWWLCIGIVLGASLTALHLRTWKVRTMASWWRRNHNTPVGFHLIAGFAGGVLMLLGAGLAHGGASEHFVGGWAQLSLSAVPFTTTMVGFGMLVAYLIYPKTPGTNSRGQ